MRFKLTSSQKNFYNKNFTLDSQIWNQGVMQIFPKVYSYEEINNAYNKLVETHDSLRVKLVETEDGIVADVKEHEYINYRFWQVETEEELMQKAQDFLNEPTDRYGLLVDCAIFQTPTTSGVMINAHHIVVDGFSALVMSEHINNFLKDENFAPIIQKYPKYVQKEEKYKQSRRYAKSKEFWLNEFSSNPKCQIFSATENAINFSSSEMNKAISADLFKRIKAFCDEKEITPASFFNTVNAIYLHRMHEIENFTIGVPVFNRTTAEELNTIGLYMHLVPLVINVQSDSFINNARRIEDSQMNLFRHQSFTQQDIKELLSENNFETNNLFDVVSDFQEFAPNNEYEMRIPYGNTLSVPIEMHLQTFDEGKHNLKIRYRTAYFGEKDIQIMLKSIIALAENALENPDKNIFELKMVSTEENTILKDFNDTEYTYDIEENTTLYSLFEQKSEENKEKVCIIANDEEITFKDFKAYAERLDNKIRAITEEKSVIAVICERSFEMYGAVYGIIRGGNAYLPIDPNYPQDRIDYILSNSNAKAVIAQEKFCHLAGNTVCINATEVLNSNEQPVKTEILANENDTAYVIYTSGSTGNPKGAKISHKSAVNRILWMHDFYPLEENDVILQKTPYTFDVSVWELFWWGITGRTLCASKPDEHFLPAKILNETEKNKVTHLHFVPSVFDLFLTYLENNPEEQEKFNTVKYVFLSGEALTANSIKRFYNIYDYNKVSLHNLYGPTECAVDVSYYPCVPTDIDPVPIGKPIYNTQLHIVDKNLNPTPIGVIGELCIAGVNVGQGYLNNETLTNEKFIDNPFGSGKLYKTGDLAYWREDGQICYVGRNDFQVKINGQRIELGEIENAIAEIDGVVQCAVIVRKQYICAFYTGKEIDVKELRTSLSSKLPRYMVPHSFTYLEALPMTVSGKLNRKALPEIDIENISTETEIVLPHTEEEKALAEVISSVLRTEKVNMLDNFFNVGGDSITAIYLVSELEEMGYELHVADIMQSDTLQDVAKAMKVASNKVIYDQYEVNGFIPFSPIMRAFLKEEKEIPRDFVHTCIVVADCDKHTAKKAIDVLISHHDILRGTFTDNGIEVIPSDERKVYSFNTISINDKEKAIEYLKDITLDDKLVKIVFCKTEKESFISFTVHHFLIDLVSWEVLAKDFSTVAKQLKNNEKIYLPAKTASFKLWSKELEKYSEITENKKYWEEISQKLDNAKTLSLSEKNGAEEYSITLDTNTSSKLINDVNTKYGTRTNEVLLTAVGLAAGKIAEGTVGIMVESHGRTELHRPISTERTVGWFTSCYPVVINSSNNIAEELIGTKDTMRRIPKNGVEYLLLNDGFHKNTDILFNFYKTSLAEENREDRVVAFGGTSVFPGKININCFDLDNIITINISIPKGDHKANISEELGLEIKKQIESIVAVCTEIDTVVKTVSDFSDNELTENELDELMDLFDWGEDNEE